MSKSYLDNAGVGILSSLMKKAIKDTVESAKDQLFVVTVTPNGPPEEHDAWLTMKYTPSVTFAEAVAQAKSGKKVVIGMGDNLDAYIRMDLISGSDGDDIFLSKDETGLFGDENIKTFKPVLVEHYQWDSNKLCLIVDFTLPKWIGDTKPTYTASEVGADASGAATQALTDAKTWAGTELAKKEDKALYITMTEGDYDPSTGQTPVTFSESYETVLTALQAKKRVLTCDKLGFPAELYFSDLLGGIFGKISYPDTVEGRGIFWSGEQDGYIEEINATKPPRQTYFTLRASDWDSSTKSQTVRVAGVSANESAQVIQPIPAIASQSAYYAAGILATGQAENHVTFTAATIPTTNLNIYVVVTEVRE